MGKKRSRGRICPHCGHEIFVYYEEHVRICKWKE
jgi:NADH pyrophosphatase NudC (nudix superfamily)